MGRYARSVATMSARLLMVTVSWPVISVDSLFAGLAMNTRGSMGINLVLSAKPLTRGTRVMQCILFPQLLCFRSYGSRLVLTTYYDLVI